VVVTTSDLAGRLPAGSAAVLALDQIPGDRHAIAHCDPAVRVSQENLVYLMFTSGSTGKPKAVGVPHRGVIRLVQDPGYVHLDHTDVVLHVSSTSFDAATFEIWGALCNGACLAIEPGPVSGAGLAAMIREHAATVAFLTAGMFHLMVGEYLDELSGMRQLLAGGDVMSPVLAHRFVTAAPHCRLANAYGPTEATTFTTCYSVPSQLDDEYGVPIGTPIRNTWVQILDEELRPVPVGLPGFLYAGGDGLARGYLDDPALTAQRFIPDPSARGLRLYATGDRALRRPDGQIAFLGRADLQVKKRGFRVEPAEIEEALRRDPAVSDAAVVLHGDRPEEAVITAYFVTRGSATGQAEPAGNGQLASGIRNRLREQLPGYLIPDRFVAVKALPLTPNGKVDRRALASVSSQPSQTHDASSAAPVNELESAISTIWCEVLGLQQVSRNADFFDLGGQSLLASRMAARIRSRLGVEIPLREIFDHPTLGEIAELVSDAL
jgi:amino acid adenylation domain-containing protein